MRIAIVGRSEQRTAIVEEGLRETGFRDIIPIPADEPFVAELEKHSPDVVIFDLGLPSDQRFDEALAVSRALSRPVAMFVDNSDEQMIAAAIEAGVSAYVVDGLKKERVKPIVELAVQRFNAFVAVQKELEEAKAALTERRIIDRAKLYLMSTRKLTEANAYALLRGTAMRQGRRIADIAQALVTAAELLESKPEDEAQT